MKKTILILALLVSINAYSQTDSTRIEQYCEIVATGKLFSKKVTIEIDFGEQKSFWKDNRLKDEATGKLQSFNTVTDAINFMGKNGWKLVNAFPINNGSNGSVYHFYFKKDFLKSDLASN